MMAEDYVSFETAKLLKEKGFYQDFLSEITPVWKLNGNRTELAFYGCDNYPCEIDEWYSAPTLQMAMKWLREVHKIEIRVIYDNDELCWYGACNPMSESQILLGFGRKCKSYEEACEAAIKYCLKKLI